MAPVKRRPHARSQHRMTLRYRQPNIPELVYKFLEAAGVEPTKRRSSFITSNACRICGLEKQRGRELESFANSRKTGGKRMANKQKGNTGNSKSHGMKRHRTVKNQKLSSCVHNCGGNEGLRRVKMYIQKALDFGVESGYLIPRDSTYKVLRVSSDLLTDRSRRNKVSTCERTMSQERDRSPRRQGTRFEDYQVQDAPRRRRRRRSKRGRRRSRSRSKRRRRSGRRGRRRSRSENPEELAENPDNYELEDDEETRDGKSEDADRDPGNARLNQQDGEKTTVKGDEETSDLSQDEDETDDEEEKKGDDADKS